MAGNETTIIVSIISMIGGLGTAYIVNIASKKVNRGKVKKGPSERIDELFDGYERLIKQKDIEDERKAKLIQHLESEISEARKKVQQLERELENTKSELDTSRLENIQLKKSLDRLRSEVKTITEENGTI